MVKRYRFSVIMPVYNKAEYLQEALDSVFHQTIGFEENIQLILINDGSTDESPTICAEAADRYPRNVICIDQDNAGVSAARNAGLRYALGEIVTFFDADDIWDDNAFEVASSFFEEHESETDVLIMRLVQFGDVSGEHILNYKFDEDDAVVSLVDRPDYVQSAIGNCFFCAASLRGRFFDESLMCAEDTQFVNCVFLDKQTCGLSSRASYLYRKVVADQTASMSRSRLRFASNNAACETLYQESIQRLGCVAPFVAYVALYELCWQVLSKCEDAFSPDECREWHASIEKLLAPVRDEDICFAPWLTTPKRLALLALKHGKSNLSFVPWNEAGAWVSRDGETALLRLSKLPLVTINRVRISDGQLFVRALTRVSFFSEHPVVFVRVRGVDDYPVTLSPFPAFDVTLITQERFLNTSLLSFSLPIDTVLGHDVFVIWQDDQGIEHRLPLRFALYGGLPTSKSYLLQDDLIVRHPKLTALKLVKATIRARASSEFRMLESIAKNPYLARVEKARIVGLRIAANAYRLVKRKPVWIYVDREYKAADSAEALYAYARQKVSSQDASMYFLLAKRSPDYRRLKELGRVLKPGSLRFYLKFLVADKLFSGHHDALVTNPFGPYGKWLIDICTWNFYNLSHGTLQGDLSSQLNVHVRPVHRFFVSTDLERELLLGESYGYSEREVCLSGMCRYDLYDLARTKKKIVFLPTWRASLAGRIIPGTREREYIEDFESSEYCQTLNGLINDVRLLRAMQEMGYEGEFYVHPNYEKQAPCFHGNDVIAVGESSADYVRVLSEGALLITDYSGVSFDFAYMRKPVIYYHFDDLFSGGHSYQKQDFDYQSQGFGPVCKTREELVSAIRECLGDGCEMRPLYRDRADDFFAFSDKGNCGRVLDVVLNEDD